ncbi:SDR family NAD(P)-dependent oxidoreductase [Enemella sp. A6]|uniref:SDR family NAD(P)-dependent oxidoreductase n=1 Tax=Enemella sp. A6 TaxID=3440152 RepID=UPI003EBABFB1
MSTALVTGGTSGIGAAFAAELASRGTDLVLVARDSERLADTAQDLRGRFGIEVEILAADLDDHDDTQRVAERLLDQSRPIDLLVNNAGFGLHSTLLGEDISVHERAINVMMRAVFVLTNAAARAMVARGRGRIINVASSSAYITMGHYSAIKSYVLTLSEGLSVELRGTGVAVTAVCPGWVRTEFHDRAGIDASKLPNIVWVDIEDVVREGLAASEAGKVVCVPVIGWKVATVLARLVPRVVIRQVSSILVSTRRK